jgi:hypothetical protein
MNQIVSNENGFVGGLLMALVAVIMTVVATVSFMTLVQMDTNEVHYLQDKFQQELFLRSEVKRINLLLENNSVILPPRTIEMVNDNRVATYKIKLKQKRVTLTNALGLPMEEAVAVQALITQTRNRAFVVNATKSPVARYIEKLSNRKNLSQYAYFSDNEASDLYLDGPQARVKFWGLDELWGPVHSNKNIWIQEASGSGTPVNDQAPGWPLFHGMVTTAEKFMNHTTNAPLLNSGAPENAIFQGPPPGKMEGVAEIPYIPTADLIRTKGLKPFPSGGNENKIFRCQIAGSMINVSILDFSRTRIDTFVVYKRYPDALHPIVFGNEDTYIADSLWTNYITVRDTLWNPPQSFAVNGTSIFIPGVAWIEGGVHGKMTIGTEGDAYPTSNIYYLGTPLGQLPITENAFNTTDYFGLVSEGKIIIKYKYREPNGGSYITHANNATGPDGHVYLYGAYAALGAEAASPIGFLTAGTLTYEYQHPHGAVMPFRGKSQKTNRDTLYKFIDLHRHRFPPAPANMTSRPLWHRWPNQTPDGTSNGFPNNSIPQYDYTQVNGPILYRTSDYPWYNPVWPEKDAGENPANIETDITWERGTLHIFGSIAQRRRGFIHRSGTSAANNNPDTGIWDPGLYDANGNLKMPIYGPPHRSTGYEKDYRYDERLTYVHPPHFPEVYKGGGAGAQSAFDEASWDYKVPPRKF